MAPTAAKVMLGIEDLGFDYGGAPALVDVGFTVRAGEFKMLLGPNGAGKTTLFSLITRLFESPQGRITIDGHDLRRAPGRALAVMGVVFQQPSLDLDLSVRQNLAYHASLHGLSPGAAAGRMDMEMGRLGLAERMDHTVRQLNGGHRRRVEIARALLHQPKLLLLDEPTVGLDVPSRRAMVEHVHALAREDGIAVLWATHLIDELDAGDNVVVLHRGTVRADGSASHIVQRTGQADMAGAFTQLTADD